MDRRKFVKNSALASSMLFVPGFIKAFDELSLRTNGYKRLVIIQLTGGNDGLNTIVPFRNDTYYKNRPYLGLKKNDLIRLNDELGLHSSLQPLKTLYDQGYVSVLNNVGYPNPDRSHFRSTDIWQSASHSHQFLQTGWIGRYLDHYGEKPYHAIEVDESLSMILKGQTKNGLATNDARRLFRTSQLPYFKRVLAHQTDTHLSEHNLGYLYKTMISAESSARYIYETSKTYRSTQNYPGHAFGKQLKTTAEFINSGLDTHVFYASLPGFDTHAGQSNVQSRLLKIYAESIESFVADLKQNDTFKDTLILTFSEFGRRVEENAARGTDHGAANNVFLIGEGLQSPGIYNPLADLSDLDANGDIKYTIDFRSIYATLLSKWLSVDDEKILNDNFVKLNLL